MIIPPHHMNIDRKIGAIHLKGSADLKETRITGLSHVQRVGDAVLKNENGSFAAKLHLGDNNVKIFSDLDLHFLGNIIHPHLKVSGARPSNKCNSEILHLLEGFEVGV